MLFNLQSRVNFCDAVKLKVETTTSINFNFQNDKFTIHI